MDKQKSSDMAQRVLVNIPDKLKEALKQEAEDQGRTLSDLCGFLLETAWREHKDDFAKSTPEIRDEG